MGNKSGNGGASKSGGGKSIARLPVTIGEPQARSKVYRDDSRILFPVHGDGDVVEYYSATHKVWMTGVVHLELIDDDEGESQFAYDVCLRKTKQVRHDVPVDMLRTPFQSAELVECFSRRDGGQWVPGSIEGLRSPGYSLKSYKVRVEGRNRVPPMFLDSVPSWRIRRRFPPGSSIEVYCGPESGWRKRVVHAVAAEFPAEPPLPLSAFSPGSPNNPSRGAAQFANASRGPTVAELLQKQAASPDELTRSTPRKSLSRMSTFIDDATICASTVSGEGGVGVSPWVQIPVYTEDWDEVELAAMGKDPDAERADWTPSYLIRSAMVHWSGAENDRRGFAV